MTLPQPPTIPTVQPGQPWTSALFNSVVGQGLTYTLNRPIAVLYQTTAQSIPSNTANNVMQWNAEFVDTYGGHSNVTNNSRYTAQVAGWYQVMATIVMISGSAGSMYGAWQVNGSVPTVVPNFEIGPVTGSHNRAATVSGLQYLNVGDYLEVVTWQDSGSAVNTAIGPSSSLSIVWEHE